MGGPGSNHQDLKTCTARITYWRQMGHSFIRFPHLVQVTMWPHSSRTQSIGESMQILHIFSSALDGAGSPTHIRKEGKWSRRHLGQILPNPQNSAKNSTPSRKAFPDKPTHLSSVFSYDGLAWVTVGLINEPLNIKTQLKEFEAEV